jgi:polyisoprenoid-binding protein YceI
MAGSGSVKKGSSRLNRCSKAFGPFFLVVPLVLLVLGAVPQHATPQAPSSEIVLGVDPAVSAIHWSLGTTLHTVHGTFALKSGTIHVDPGSGKASGEILADATTGKSDNDSRDRKMHKEVLESARYPEVIFRPDRVEGKVPLQGNCTAQVHGIFVLHGSEHEITIPVQAELEGQSWFGSAKFSVPFIDWGLKNPSNFLLRVNHAVDIELQLKGSLQKPTP